MKRFLTALLALSLTSTLSAQSQLNTAEPCGFDYVHKELLKTDAEYRTNIDVNEAKIQEILAANRKNPGNRKAGVVTIPIVFHIIHKGEAVGTGTNISDAQVQSAIDGMNIQYRNKNTDGSVFDASGIDLEMEFCLAQKDPSGLPTSGINRVDGSTVANYAAKGIIDAGGAGSAGAPANETAVKALSRWDNKKYYNVWVVIGINGEVSTGGGTQGYAYFPGAGATVDGTVVLYNACGYCPGSCPGFNLKSFARDNGTMVHEIGHAFSLYHTFEGGDANGGTCPPTETNCATQGDRICDTERHRSNLGTCKATGAANDCTGGTYTVGVARNYMNYTNCSPLIFTPNQRDRIQATFVTGGPRFSLTQSDGCDAVFPYDIALKSISEPSGFYCNTNVGGKIFVKNTGANVISSFSLDILVDGVVAGTHTWTGSLANNTSTSVDISPIIATIGAHTYELRVITNSLNGYSQTDGLATNNNITANFEVISNGTIVTLDVTDGAADDSFVIKNTSTGAVVKTITLNDGLPFNTSICLPAGCYDFVMTDKDFRPINGIPSGLVPDFILKDDRGYEIATGIKQKSATTSGEIGQPKSETVPNKCLPFNPGYLDADFKADQFIIVQGSSIQFTDLTVISAGSPSGTNAASSWEWNFGDGGTDLVRNPVHQFNTPGVYTVRLIAANNVVPDTAIKNHYIRVLPATTGCDQYDNLLSGEAPIALTTVNGTYGYYPGPNNTNPAAYAEKFLAPSASNLKSVDIFTTVAYSTNPNALVTISVYGNSGGMPGASLGSVKVPLSSLIVGNYTTGITFPNPIPVLDFFFVGVEVGTSGGDTIVLAAADYRGANNFSNTAFVLYNNSWKPISTAFTGSSPSSLAIKANLSSIPIAKFDSDVIQTCTGKVINFNGTTSISTNSFEWTFEGGAPTTAAGATPSATFNMEGVKKITLVAKGGCNETDTIVKTVTIAPPPSVTIEGIDEVCNGANGLAKAIPAGGSNDYTFSWNTSPVQTSATATGLTAGSYTVTMIDNKCGTVTRSVSLTNLTKLPDFEVEQSNTTCGLNNGGAKANPVGGTGTYTYNWTKTGDISFNQTGRSAVNLGPGTYTVEVQDGSCNPNQKSVTIAASLGVSGSVSSTASAICEGEMVSLTATGGNGYIWNDGTSNIAYVANIDVSPSSSKTYSVRISDAAGCFIDLNKTVTVTQAPTAFAEVSNNSSGYGEFTSVDVSKGEYTYFSSAGSLGNGYKWVFGDGDSSDFKNPYHLYTTSGIYRVYLYVTIDGCTTMDSATVTVFNSTGISSNFVSNITIYPNPTSGIVRISNPDNIQISSIAVFDLVGKQVAKYNAPEAQSFVHVSTLSTGSYIVKIETHKGLLIEKLEIIR